MNSCREKSAKRRVRQTTAPTTDYNTYLNRSKNIVSKDDVNIKQQNNGNIIMDNNVNCIVQTYNPNNSYYSQQGATSQSEIINRIKFFANNKNLL